MTKYFRPVFTIGLTLAVLALFLGGYGNTPTSHGLVLASIGVFLLGISTLLQPNETLQAVVGSGLLLYGIWWLAFPNIETYYNLMTGTLLVTGSIILLAIITRERPEPKHRLNIPLYLVFLFFLLVLAIYCYDQWG